MEKNSRYNHKTMKGVKIEYPFYLFLIIGFTFIFAIGCKKVKAILPEVNTTDIIFITPVSANCNGIVISTGSSVIIDKGICWSNIPLPLVSDNKISGKLFSNFDTFSLRIGGLIPSAPYYIRAYATSEAGTSYGNELSFTTPEDISGQKGTVTDVEGNVYQTVGIGSQFWTAENLKTTKFNDGTSIPLVTDNRVWSLLFTPAYCWYNNAELNKNTYGALYNWYAIGTGKLCPSGWHVPNNSEWTVLTSFLGGSGVAGGKMKVSGTNHWNNPNLKATNSSEFSGLPGGFRGSDGSFVWIKEVGLYWTASGNTSNSAWYQELSSYTVGLFRGSNILVWGASVRCVKN